ncbi:MAG: RagB/SusD family nutrient uptake outer membrane protein [Prevotella sp.]|nr:RagB/SusD family nutrient uptake outer membrane protein [Prevotella sp.]
MKKILYIAASAVLSLGMVSCSLDAENLTDSTSENFPKTEEDATASLAAIYENLNAVNATPQASFYYLSMLASDDNLGGGGANDKLMQALDLLCNYNANMTEQFYKDRYEGIGRANALLQALPNTNLSDDFKAQAIGEAKFLRAFYYYELASQYGNVPLATEPGQDPVQGDVDDLWAQILMDLRDAAEDMPEQKLTDGHVDKYTAEGMLARVWLFYTGFYGNGEEIAQLTSTSYNPLQSVELPDGTTLTKQNVIDYVDDCVEHSGYDLVEDYRNLWAYTNKYTVESYPYTAGQGLKWVEDDNAVNPESMFAIKFNKLASWNTTIGYGNGYALHFGIRGGQDVDKTFPFGQGWGAGPVAPNLVSDWTAAEPSDIRRDASIQDVRELPQYAFGGATWADFIQETNYFEKKQCAIAGTDGDTYQPCFEVFMYGDKGWSNGVNFQTSNIHDLVLLRFADVLLMQSELKQDVTGINRVRQRAGLPTISSYSDTALRNERRWELAFEGVRWNDIRRWHIAADALEKQTNQPTYSRGIPDTNKAHNGGYKTRYNATAGFQKMPENQVLQGRVAQNEGWTSADSEYQGW